jgi:hypothetical protein
MLDIILLYDKIFIRTNINNYITNYYIIICSIVDGHKKIQGAVYGIYTRPK